MTDVTQILSQIEHGDPPPRSSYWCWSTLSCGGWRRRSWPTRSRAKRSTPRGWSTKPTCDLFGNGRAKQQHWDSRGHFFAAAAEAMRRILIENARRKKRLQARRRPAASRFAGSGSGHPRLARRTARLGCGPDESGVGGPDGRTIGETPRILPACRSNRRARVLGFSRATAYRHWNYARAWLRCEIEGTDNISTGISDSFLDFVRQTGHERRIACMSACNRQGNYRDGRPEQRQVDLSGRHREAAGGAGRVS